jgi:hypothetical protein
MIRRDTQRDNPVRTGVMVISAITLLLALILILPATCARAAADPASFDYVTKRCRTDEIERLKPREKDLNLKLVFTLVEGNYVSDVAVTLKDKAGNPVGSAGCPKY